MMDGETAKIVTWVLEPELLELMFKRAHGLGVGAEMIAVSADSTTGLIACMFEVSDEVFTSLSEMGIENVDMSQSEIFN